MPILPQTSQLDQPNFANKRSSPFFSAHCRKTGGILSSGCEIPEVAAIRNTVHDFSLPGVVSRNRYHCLGFATVSRAVESGTPRIKWDGSTHPTLPQVCFTTQPLGR